MSAPCPPRSRLESLLAGGLDEAAERAVSRHVEGCLACQQILETLTDSQSDASAPRPSDAGGADEDVIRRLKQSRPLDGTLVGPRSPSWPPPAGGSAPLPWVPGYQVLEEVGRGGMGVIYRARHAGLQRVVALKMILSGACAGAKELARFQTEAEAVARLNHPHVVQIYDVGQCDGRPFLALEFVEGGSLKRLLDGTPWPARQAAELVRTLARAVQHAHDNGILHRDLKPGNVLMAGAPAVPKIADFGLAKLAGYDNITQSGDVIGTPSYVAPEQVSGRGVTGPAADVYALGAILYELLTARPPFLGESPLETLALVLDGNLVSATRLRAGLSPDLGTITMKCLEREPRRRYPSAAALADDLDRFLDGRPIQARPVGRAERAWRWARRRPALAALTGLLLAVTAAAFVLVSWQWGVAVTARGEAERRAEDERRARLAEAAARRQAALLSAGLALDQGIKLCEEGQTGPGLLWMARALELTPEGADDLEFAIRANLGAWRGQFCPVRRGEFQWTPVTAVAFSPDGGTLLTGNWGGRGGTPSPADVILWDVSKGVFAGRKTSSEHGPLPAPPLRPAVRCAAFSPDGKTFATGSFDGTARLWSAATGKPLGDPLAHSDFVFALAFSPDGKTLATAEAPAARPAQGKPAASLLRFWDAATGKLRDGPIRIEGVGLRAMAWGAKDATLALGGTSGEGAALAGVAYLWDVAGRRLRGGPLRHPEAVNAVGLHPDGGTLATAGADGVVRFWDTTTGTRQALQLRHPHAVNAIAFGRKGAILAAGGGAVLDPRRGPGEVRVWDVATGQLLVQPLKPRAEGDANVVHAVALSGDGRLVAAGSANGRAWLWDVGAAPRPVALIQHPTEHYTFLLSPDGGLVLMNGHSPPLTIAWVRAPSELRLYRTATGEFTGVVLPHPTAVTAQFTLDGKRLFTLSHPVTREDRLRLWDVATGRPVPLPAALAEGVTGVALGPDGRTLLTGHRDGKVRRWDVTTFKPSGEPLTHGAPVRSLGVSPDGQRLFTAAEDSSLRLWSLPDGGTVGSIDPEEAWPTLTDVFFAAGSRSLVTAWGSGRQGPKGFRLWNAADGALLGKANTLSNGFSFAAFPPGGDTFLTGLHDGHGNTDLARLWDATTGAPVGSPLAFRISPEAAAFHPSGRLLALGGYENHARLWAVPANKPVGPAILHPGQVLRLAFHPGGRLLATGGKDGAVRLWGVPESIEGSREGARLRVEALTGLELDDTGGVRELSEPEHRARLEALASPP